MLSKIMLDVIKLWFSILGDAVNAVSRIADAGATRIDDEKAYKELAELVEYCLKNQQQRR